MTSKRKDIRMKRSTAEKLTFRVRNSIREYNDDALMPYCITRAVFFGSYVNSDCETLGDLDVAIQYKKRYDDMKIFDECCRIVNCWCSSRGDLNLLFWPSEHMFRCIRSSHPYVSIHNLEIDGEAVFSKEVQEIDIGSIDHCNSEDFYDMAGFFYPELYPENSREVPA
jgi:predicted nucleotidyltransferase